MKQHNKPKVICVLRPRVKASSDESLANHLASTDNQWSNCGGTWGNGVLPLRFWRGNAVPLAYTMTATYNTSNRKKCALNA